MIAVMMLNVLHFCLFARSHLYYASMGSSPHIARSSLAGRNRQVLVSSDLIQPRDLTLDFASDKLFWVDLRR